MTASGRRALMTLAGIAGAVACQGTLDAGRDQSIGPLPVDHRNPMILCNDGAKDNWQGEYALLFGATSGPRVVGIVVNASAAWPDLEVNVAAWRNLVAAARASGVANVPEPVSSVGAPLQMPPSGEIDDTVPNRSEGARAILDAAAKFARPNRPLVVATGGRLTDVADAYLLDHGLPARVVVVSSLGTAAPDGTGEMGLPNGEMDPWADAIVADRFRYVQVNAYYNQLEDVPASLVPQLPANAFGDWIRSKRASILSEAFAADQVAPIALAVPEFIGEVQRVASDGSVTRFAGPSLRPSPDGHVWLVSRGAGPLATARFWQLLLSPETYGASN